MKTKRFDLVLILILLAAAYLNTYHIWQDDTANQYYLAAVKSMTQSFHNFFYASFDPSGFVTVDKPPVVLWIQTIFALIFGVHTWSVILPQALSGVGSVFLLYRMIKPAFGIGAARIAALVMTLTPIAAAVSRTNNIDSMLVFTLLLGSACLLRAVKQDKLVWLLTAFALIGLAFNMKMMQAFMVLPAFVLFYLIASRVSLKKKTGSLILSLVLLTGLSISWAVVVDSTSSSSRPYVGSSQTNSVLELAFGYNGTERLLGQTTGLAQGDINAAGGGNMQNHNTMQAPNSSESSGNSKLDGSAANQNGNQSFGNHSQAPQPPTGQNGTSNGGGGTPPTGGNGPGNGGPGGGGGKSMNMFGTGDAGPLRLFQSALSGQISWMLPFALIGLLGGIVSWYRDRRGQAAEMKETIFWAAWLVPVAGFFSVAGFFHQYYLIMLAPPIAALSGIGWYTMYRLYKNNKDWASYLLPAAVLITAAFQVYILSAYTSQIGSVWMYVLGLSGLGITLALLMLKRSHPFSKQLTIISLCVLLLTPVYWSATPLLYGGNSVLPESGPQLKSSANGGNMFSSEVDTGLLSYLRKHNTGEEYLFATLTTVTAAPYIIHENESVMAMGGFNGTDPILTVSKLKKLVKEGKVKYFLLSGNNSGNSELVSWIKKNGKEISSDEYSSSSSSTNSSQQGMRGGPGGESQQTLYLVE
ncbi:glycosyltransferase family 39 protein [Bacillus inaquosorum]|uniref:glycosyltransferase family 39 protein n=1 Tax=Bacillus inaquosorum TaxID=483913 RepID=UPI00228036C0|nr:glycosyltransferase family 39 protein [Bacillus inaquosorum]MCY7910117.1 glycosyltransferase family 39 protein [Bacillus inaquosorum]MCY8502832.1 glycosyltransferase family 39 protein [Bacillus inaquosorum]MCY8786760.1 glycosyltransferase family 39 protein [Bacillus inaquosorum]MCY8862724.1 glycosyltransferase family 39 protein [Bacillus inaquosorum]MCY8877580.1 glycosyltransferase family 39 protein [Bacillus inaquosorum]